MPAVLSRSYAFNNVTGVDLIELGTNDGSIQMFWLRVVCWDTVYGKHKMAAVTIRAVIRDEAKHYGWPAVCMSDGSN